MKIGILTFHRACNFGGALQCYALVSYLRNEGYDAEVIDYRSRAIENAYKLLSLESFKSIVISFLYFKQRYKLKKHFADFRKQIPISKAKYSSAEELSGKYDTIIMGSDQIWSKRINHGFDELYWGYIEGIPNIISYAASMGTDHDYSIPEKELIRKYLANLNAISVREASLKKELEYYTDKTISMVLDPTLLLSVDDYRLLAENSQDSEPYVFFYNMEQSKFSHSRVEDVAKQLNAKVVVVGGPKEEYGVKSEHYKFSDVSVPIFINYILNAKCVFASSFHGVALSIAMQKDFYFLSIKAVDRAENLLKNLGAINRSIKPEVPITFSQIDYSEVNNKLMALKQKSRDFLKSNIG